ncbi:MAG TPA: hypothetical protein VHD31_01855 [Candidatus Paceibacterota bacterium]|nr:hypothetical protein [Candidatus Paceibacterota bacterium]
MTVLDTTDLPAAAAAAAQVLDLTQRGFDEVIDVLKQRKAEMAGQIGDLTLQLQASKVETKQERERADELRKEITRLEANVAKLQKEIDDYPLLFTEQVMSRLRGPFEKMKQEAIAEIMK